MNAAPSIASTRPAGATRSARPRHTTLERVSQAATVGMVILFTLFVLAVSGFAAFGMWHAERAFPGTTVAGIDVGGMTREEVAGAVDARFQDLPDTPITLTAAEQQFDVTVTELGITLDENATVDRVMTFGRSGSLWERSLQWTRGAINGNDVDPVFVVDDRAFRDALALIAPEVTFAPSDAFVEVTAAGQASLVADVPGRSLNVTATREGVLDQITSLETAPVPLALLSQPASVRAADIQSGVPDAQRAVANAIEVQSPEGKWGLSRSDLSKLVWVDDSGTMQVRRDGVEAYVQGLASQINHRAEDAQITVDETGAFVVVPQVDSAAVDVAATTDRLVSAIEGGSTTVDIEVEREEPSILTAEAEEWAGKADALVGDGLELTWHGGSSQLGRADLIAAMVIEPQPEGDEPFAISFDEEVLAERLTPLQEDLFIEKREASFRLVNDQIKFQAEARKGREMDMDGSITAILDGIDNGDDSVSIQVDTVEPTYTGAVRDEIALPDVLGESQTWYGGSSEPRRHNVERATKLEDGWLVPPDGVFSYAEVMGLVDEANGFVTGFGIVAEPGGGVTTAPVIGGGICQVSTTIFQAAFWAGLEIVERWAHPYWIQSYGEAPFGMKGLDAMVNIEPDWALDLKFRNTTGNWIALVMVADGQTVHAEIRGTNPGWEIDVPDPKITDVVEPKPTMMYTDSPELPKGQELQVEHAREGFTSTITRTVRDADGDVIDEYEHVSTYSASRNLTLRGTDEGEQ